MIALHRSNRLERLAESLGEMLRRPLPDAARPEIVSVQSQPMRAWLQMQIAERLGVCANVIFPFPRDLIGELLRAVLDAEARRPDPFQREALAWSIIELLPSLLGQASFEPLSRYLAGETDNAIERRFQLARRIADVYDQYMLYRPEMVLAWDEGLPQGPDGPLADGDLWQMELWRALVQRHGPDHTAARVRRFRQRAPEAVELLPRRLFLFGVTALPPLYLDVLSNLPAGVEAHLFLHSLPPSPRERAPAESEGDGNRGNAARAVLGRQARAFERLLESSVAVKDAGAGLFRDPADSAPGSPALLRALQTGIYRDRDVADAPAADGSLSLHSCHGRLREVETLRDRLLDLFARDHSLEPRHVAVLAPDIEDYAPLIDAVFGAAPKEQHIPYAIAGRPLRSASPLLEAFFAILDMAQRRCTLSEVFDLLSLDPVRQKVALSPDDVEELRELARGAGIRWGRDALHRKEHGQPALADFTFRFGLDRLLLGVAMPQDHLFGGVCPFPGPEGKKAQILGQLGAFCETLFATIEDWTRPRPLDAWQRNLQGLIGQMLADEEPAGADRQLLREALAALAQRARTAGFTGDVDLATVRDALAEEFSGEPSRGHYFSGGVTFASLLPMRAIPFRVIGLLGMGDDGFPRARGGIGFDLIARSPRPGDRCPRDDDLLQFLEAVLSAGEHLLVVYPGQGIRDNQPRPPSVAVAALLEALPPAVRGAIEVRHPLQPFSRRYFDGSDARLFSYDERYLESARGGRDAAPRRFLDAPLAEPGRADVTLDELCDFFASPVERFLRDRLGIRFSRLAGEEPQREPLALNDLEKYQVRAWLLERALDGEPDDRERQRDLLHARGMLPPGALGKAEFDSRVGEVRPIVVEVQKRSGGDRPRRIEVDVQAGGMRLSGVVDRVFPMARLVADPGKRSGKRLLDLWIRHLALCCAEQTPRPSVLICRKDGDAPEIEEVPFAPQAAKFLDDLVQIYLQGQTQPLPFFPRASFAYANALLAAKGTADKAKAAARQDYFGQQKNPGEVEPIREYVRCAFGSEEAALQHEAFASLALRVFRPLLQLRGSAAP